MIYVFFVCFFISSIHNILITISLFYFLINTHYSFDTAESQVGWQIHVVIIIINPQRACARGL